MHRETLSQRPRPQRANAIPLHRVQPAGQSSHVPGKQSNGKPPDPPLLTTSETFLNPPSLGLAPP